MEDIRTHEGEYRHHRLHNCFWREFGEAGNEEQRLMESLRVLGDYRISSLSEGNVCGVESNLPRMSSTRVSIFTAGRERPICDSAIKNLEEIVEG